MCSPLRDFRSIRDPVANNAPATILVPVSQTSVQDAALASISQSAGLSTDGALSRKLAATPLDEPSWDDLLSTLASDAERQKKNK